MNKLHIVALRTQIGTSDMLSQKSWLTLQEACANSHETEEILQIAKEVLPPNDAETVAICFEHLDDVSSELDKYADIGIIALTELDEDFPKKFSSTLQTKSPTVLFASGRTELLNAECIGIVGSRNATDDELEFARETARVSCREGFVIVSGGARGIDQAAMCAAFESGGGCIGFLADSLATTTKKMRNELDSESFCIASPYSPDAGFSVGNAMGRNKLIYGNTIATVVVTSDLGKGGTWAGAIEALSMQSTRVIVADGENAPEGNRKLISKGAISLKSPSNLLEAITHSEQKSEPQQSSLF